MSFETQVLATPEVISDFTGQVIDYLSENGVDTRATHHVAMALEEILTNLGTHGRCADIPATVRIAIEDNMVQSEIIDLGPPFDLREAPDPVLTDSVEDREVGGLGLFLVRQLASKIDYSRRDGANCTTFAVARNRIG